MVIVAYDWLVPKLWSETIDEHRHQVRDAICDTTATLVFEHGLRAVTMTQIAEQTGIGRATLYKYFSDVDAILHAWHARRISAHLHQLADVRDHAAHPGQQLEAVLQAYALISHRTRHHPDAELVTVLHRDQHIGLAQQQLHDMIRDLIADGARTGNLRDDMASDELANYCLHALAAAASLPSEVAVHRLVTVTMSGLEPPH